MKTQIPAVTLVCIGSDSAQEAWESQARTYVDAGFEARILVLGGQPALNEVFSETRHLPSKPAPKWSQFNKISRLGYQTATTVLGCSVSQRAWRALRRDRELTQWLTTSQHLVALDQNLWGLCWKLARRSPQLSAWSDPLALLRIDQTGLAVGA